MPVADPLNVAELGLVLCGPMLRRITSRQVNVFVAVKEPCTFELVIHESPDPASATIATQVSPGTTALGSHLHVHTITLDLDAAAGELTPGHLYGYDIVFRPDSGGEQDLQALGLLSGPHPLGYAAGDLPGFALPPEALEDISLFHGSCRKPHGEGADMLAELDKRIAADPGDFTRRPHLMVLSGDQIYADDVSLPFLRTLNATARDLLQWNEIYDVDGPLTPELEQAIDALVQRIGAVRPEIVNAASGAATGSAVSVASAVAAFIRQGLDLVVQEVEPVRDLLLGNPPAKLTHVPHLMMQLASWFELGVITDDLDEKRVLIPADAATAVDIPKDVLVDAEIYCAALEAHALNVATSLANLASDASWGERNTSQDAPSDSSLPTPSAWRYTLSRIAPPQRASELDQHAELTSDAMAGHLMFLGEWYAMYLMVWSDTLWQLEVPAAGDGTDPPDTAAETPRRLATAEEAVPNYGILGATAIRQLKEDIEVMEEFARGTRHVRRLLANTPTLMILDDHEVTDDWNLNRDWVRLVYGTTAGKQLVRDALVAYAVFQDWGNQPEHYRAAAGAGGDPPALAAQRGFGQAILAAAVAAPGQRPALFDAATGFGTQVLHDVLGLSAESFAPVVPARKRWDFRVKPFDEDGAAATQRSRFQIVALDTRTYRDFLDEGAIADFFSDLKLSLREVSDPNPQIGQIAAPKLLSDDAFGFQLEEALDAGLVNIVVSPAPVFGLPIIEDVLQPTMAEKDDPEIHDQEAWASSPDAFEKLLAALRGANVVLLSGDVHYGYSNVIDFEPDASATDAALPARTVQLCSSSLKNETRMTRGLAQFGHRSAWYEIFGALVDPAMHEELGNDAVQAKDEYMESLEYYTNGGFIGTGTQIRRQDHPSYPGRSDFAIWWDETASMFDPIGLFLSHKHISLFSLPRVFPFGLWTLGTGMLRLGRLALLESSGGGVVVKPEFRVTFLEDRSAADQRQVIGFNNVGRVSFAPEDDASEAGVTHELFWRHHDDRGQPSGAFDETVHSVLPPIRLFKQLLARLARQELQRWRTSSGDVIEETRPDGTRDSRAVARINLYHECTGLSEPVWLDGVDVIWGGAFLSYLVKRAGPQYEFEYSVAHIDHIRAAKTAREAGDTTNPFWLFDVGEREPEVGDIVCRSRAGEGELELTYDNVHEHDPALPGGMRKSYCAVVVDVQPAENRIVVVGGNYSDSVGAQEHVLSNGHLRPADFFALIAIDTH